MTARTLGLHLFSAVILVVASCTLVSGATSWPTPPGNIASVHDLLTRILPSHAQDFSLTLQAESSYCCSKKPPCFCVRITEESTARPAIETEQQPANRKIIHVHATTISDMTAGIGWFLRHDCNITIGWPRGGGSTSIAQREVLLNHYLRQPDSRPPIEQHRQVPLNYLMNVCTHSYSLVWYSWTEWEAFIDWLALSGINMVLALTGQEEIQHRVYTKLGLSDVDIRHWFNGPAFLTWSRGQNEYGAGIAGPIPRSFLRDQFQLQKEKILPRLRSLGIVGQLPAFQGNVPIQLKELYSDNWIYSPIR